jgi:hypothetical protein
MRIPLETNTDSAVERTQNPFSTEQGRKPGFYDFGI